MNMDCQKILDHVSDHVLMVDQAGRVLFANQSVLAETGMVKDELSRMGVEDLFIEIESASHWGKKYFDSLKKAAKPRTYSFHHRHPIDPNHNPPLEVTAMYGQQGKTREYVLLIGRNTTEKRDLKKKLQESENRYRLLSDQAVDGIFTIDLQGRIIYANKASSKIINGDLKRARARFIDYVEEKSVEKAWRCFNRVKKGASVIRYELEVVDKKKNVIPVEFTASPIYKNGKIIQILTIVRDISRRKQFEKLLAESEKMKALQDFIAGTTYEIYHPLKGLLDQTEKLVQTYKEKHFEYIGYKEFRDIMSTLEIMRDQIKYCFNTTNHLIDINRRKLGLKDASCDVNAGIKEVLGIVRYQRDALDITFSTKLTARLPLAAIDLVDFKQVITNLLTNAIQSIAGRGEIVVRTRYLRQQNKIQIECQDTGMGIPKEIVDRVFEPFFTTKQRGLEKSSGLGLAIVRSIVQTAHGQTQVSSHLGVGTTIRVLLPVYQKDSK